MPRSSLLGRDEEAAAIGRALLADRVPLLTLTGPGGVGKTRLALAAAAALETEYADGVIFVPLASARDPELVLPTIARTLGLRESPGIPLAETVKGVLRDREALLVLDNLEQVDGCAPALAALLEACPRVQMLATSRVRLRLGAEQLHPVAPLPIPQPHGDLSPGAVAVSPAAALFVQRARQVRPEFLLTEANAPIVAAIVSQLDGLPLAIELAAARVSVLSPEALLARLDRRLRLLTGGPDDASPRLRSMTDAIAWSYDLLDPAQQALFRRLAVFVGGFDAEAAIAVTGDDAVATLDGLRALADHSLILTAEASGPRGRDIARFTMLETVREFGLERLTETNEADLIRERHAAWIVALAESAEPHLLGPQERRWSDQLDAELGNMRAAIGWALDRDPEAALRIFAGSLVFWCWRVPISEGRRFLDQALRAGQEAPAAMRARALSAASLLAIMQGDVAANQTHAAAAIALSDEAGDRLTAGWALSHQSAGMFFTSEPDAAIALIDRGLALLREAPTSTDRSWRAYTRAWRGLAEAMRGNLGQAVADYEAALAQARAAGSEGIMLFILDDFAGLLLETGEIDRARSLVAESLEIATGVGEVWLVAHALLTLAYVQAAAGEATRAAQGLGAAETLYAMAGLTMPAPQRQRTDLAAARAEAALGSDPYRAARNFGAHNPLAIVAAALRPWPDRPPLPTALAAVPGLTAREADVLRLLAAGKTDREIAAALFISRKTASNHVSSILGKLGVATRAAAVVAAVQGGYG